METEPPNPLVHELKLSPAQKVQMLLLGLFLVPIRIAMAALLFLIIWPIAKLRFAGLSAEERAMPVKGWRRWLLHHIILLLSRGVFFCLGFFWVKVKGRRASPCEAPMLAAAPHTSFLDMLILCPTSLPTVVSRSENSKLPVIGALLEFNQSLLVTRKDPNSRRLCATQLKERLTSKGRWPQMLLFPEGTTTNGQALMRFKPGAFVPGVPIQPVLLHYPNKLDTVRWTWKGTTWFQALWYTSSQLYTNVTVEFLPVYVPSLEEKNNPTLYADNVQKLMARALGIPPTNYVMEGKVPVQKLGTLSLPLEPPAKDVLNILSSAGLSIKAAVKKMVDHCQSGQGSYISVTELGLLLGVTSKEKVALISDAYSKGGKVDLREVAFSVATISGLWEPKSLLHTAFTVYDVDCKGKLTPVEFKELISALLGFPQPAVTEMYMELTSCGQPTRENVSTFLTTHPIYRNLLYKYQQPSGHPKPELFSPNGRTGSHRNCVMGMGTPTSHRKAD